MVMLHMFYIYLRVPWHAFYCSTDFTHIATLTGRIHPTRRTSSNSLEAKEYGTKPWKQMKQPLLDKRYCMIVLLTLNHNQPPQRSKTGQQKAQTARVSAWRPQVQLLPFKSRMSLAHEI